jgi:hypothetical protein
MDGGSAKCSKEPMNAQSPSALYPWSKDLEASSDVRQREQAAFAMLLGWMEKFVCGKGLQPGRAACEHFWSRKGPCPTRL